MSWQLETGFQSDWDREANSHIFKHLPKKKKNLKKIFILFFNFMALTDMLSFICSYNTSN